MAGLTITESRIAFSVDRQPDASQCRAEIRIYGLSDTNETIISERGGEVRLDAGYPMTIATILDGPIQRITRYREAEARVVRMVVGDVARRAGAAPVLSGVSSRSYAGAVDLATIVHDLTADMGLLADVDELPAATIRDYAVSGPSTAALTDLLADYGAAWYEDSGVVKVRVKGRPRASAPTVEVSQALGMLGTPTATDEGMDVRLLLTPIVEIGSRVLLRSARVSGDYMAVRVRHDGDTWEGPFETNLELRPAG